VDNRSQAPAMRSKFGLAEESSNILRNFNIAYVKPNQAITNMAKTAFEKIFILSEKGWTLQAMEQDEDIVILRPET
jgi:hypothetical protein